MHIKDIMTKEPICCTLDTKLDKVARQMLEHDCGEIPVCDGTKLVGVVTDRDIACRAFLRGKNPVEIPVADVMTKTLFTLNEDDDVDAALELMEEHQVRRLPVVRDGKIVGIVSQADLVAKLPTPKIATLLKSISRPAHVPA